MPVTLTITGSTIGELEQQLTDLKAQLVVAQPQPQTNGPVAAPPVAAPPTVSPQLLRQITDLKAQSGSTTGRTWLMVHTIAQHFAGQFRLSDVATQMTAAPADVKAWRRNIGRWTKRTRVVIFENVPGSHHPTLFVMPPDVRQAIIQLGP